jgi:hypothetical protein
MADLGGNGYVGTPSFLKIVPREGGRARALRAFR